MPGTGSEHSTVERRSVLVADVEDGVKTMRKVLASNATIVAAAKLDDAVSKSRRGIDLIVCGVHFDESRMLDLLGLIKADPLTRAIPFVCFRDIDTALGPSIVRGMEIACAALGAARFIDLHQLKIDHGVESADSIFRQTLLSLLDRGVLVPSP